MEFFPEVLERDPWELACLFEQWLCKREKSMYLVIKFKSDTDVLFTDIVERDTIGKLRMQSSGMIKAGLRK
jgi:hypothetical protein